jgi:hypothetical protein
VGRLRRGSSLRKYPHLSWTGARASVKSFSDPRSGWRVTPARLRRDGIPTHNSMEFPGQGVTGTGPDGRIFATRAVHSSSSLHPTEPRPHPAGFPSLAGAGLLRSSRLDQASLVIRTVSEWCEPDGVLAIELDGGCRTKPPRPALVVDSHNRGGSPRPTSPARSASPSLKAAAKSHSGVVRRLPS